MLGLPLPSQGAQIFFFTETLNESVVGILLTFLEHSSLCIYTESLAVSLVRLCYLSHEATT